MIDDPGRITLAQETELAARRSALLAELGSEAVILQPALNERDLHSAAVLLTVQALGGGAGRPLHAPNG